jgi:hypothetical protein
MSYYIYAYLDDNNQPYYIGKGKKNRAWQCHNYHGIVTPKDLSKIIIMENHLTEVGALALERFYIRWYGKKVDGTGILENKGIGTGGIYKGFKHSPETIEKMKKRIPWNVGVKHTDETRQKIKEKRKLQVITDESREKMSLASKGKPKSETMKAKLIGNQNARKKSKVS